MSPMSLGEVVRRSFIASALASSLLAASGQARAGDEAAAEALFVEAKKLVTRGKYAEACPKFAESNRLDRGAGTLIHLGDCYEKNKQTASAWATYKEAASAAQALGRKDWEKLATQRAAGLEPKLARLTVKVDAPTPEMEVRRDGTSLSQPSWGVPIPVDVGEHAVEATAPGHLAFKATASVAKDGATVEVVIPALEPEARAAPAAPVVAAAPPSAPRDASGSGSGQRTLGLVVGGVGVAGLAAGAVTGLMAMGKSSDAKAECPNDGLCTSRAAVDASEGARTLGLVSTIAFVAGGVGVAAGAALVLTAPSTRTTGARAPIRVAPNAGPGGAGLTVLGVF